MAKDRLLRGAKQIAGCVFKDESKNRAIYELTDELPLFWLGGTMAAWESSLKEAMAKKERAGLRRRRLTRCGRAA